MTILASVIIRDTRANQSGYEAGLGAGAGALYFVTDEAVIERWNGSTWDAYSQDAVSGTAGEIDVTSGVVSIVDELDLGGNTSVEIPNGAAPTVDADGEIAVDTTVADFSHGLLLYYGGEEMGVVSMPIAEFGTPSDGAVPTYNATNDEFELTVPSGTGDVVGPASSTDEALAIFDGTTGKLLKNDGLTPTDNDFLQRKSGAWANRTAAQAAVDLQGAGLDVDAAGFRGVPQNAQSGNYTLVAADSGKHIYHASGDGAGDTYTIPANASVAFEIGTAVTFVNLSSDTVDIAITSDTMYLAGDGSTGTRTLAQYGVATALKTGTTEWMISGSGLT